MTRNNITSLGIEYLAVVFGKTNACRIMGAARKKC